MPLLMKFNFSIQTHSSNFGTNIDLPSNNDILNSFISRGYGKVNSYADNEFTDN